MTTVRYVERKPLITSDGPPPLLIMLHGYGSNEQDLIGLAPYLDQRLHIISTRALFDIGFGFAWYQLGGMPGNLQQDDNTLKQSLDVLLKFVEGIPEHLGADPSRVYLFGFSQGAVMSIDVALIYPERIAGVIAISGYLDPTVHDWVNTDQLHRLHALVMHGNVDDVIPVAGGRGIRDFLQTTPVQLNYYEYDIGHGIHPQALTVMQQWLRERIEAQGPATDTTAGMV
ncbi:MAG: phospholipase [Chloroflexaceae bacterium]|nr:phospholipase [Chloroflexaceae bacterium]